jgi:phosphotransferase system enzyme I (PtsP)
MNKNPVELICDVAELSALFEETSSLDGFLDKVVGIIAHHMRAAVCSIYFYDEANDELVLRATKGLSADAVGNLRLAVGEGIAGTAFQALKAHRLDHARNSPNFKLVPGLDEERYEAFLAVPILRGLNRVGVMVVQDPQPAYFNDNDEKALRAIATQLAATIENTRLLMMMRDKVQGASVATESSINSFSIDGLFVSAGIAMGGVAVINRRGESFVASQDIDDSLTLHDFEQAVLATEQQLENLQKQLNEQYADVASLIFSAHLLMLKDTEFTGRIRDRIEQGVPTVQAVVEVVDSYARLFAESSDPRFREKALDVQDLGHRLLSNLRNDVQSSVDYTGQIVVAADPSPSDLLRFVGQNAAGLILPGGNSMSHAAILAQSLKLPTVAISNLDAATLREEHFVILDAADGALHVNPAPHLIERFQSTLEAQAEQRKDDTSLTAETFTSDGVRIHLLANVNLLADLSAAKRFNAEGIGLYRTEFPFIVRSDFPSEEEQYWIYRSVLDAMQSKQVIFRTLDVGGDKILSYVPNTKEANPFLGLRAIRFSLRNRRVFEQQLRALLRAGAQHALNIMFPLVSSLDDYNQARSIVYDTIRALHSEGVAHNSEPKLGAMIELPSAVEIIDDLASRTDFLSIGSNDLIQYMLGVDRNNPNISEFYLAHHPAVLRALKKIIDAGGIHGIAVSLCGELAADLKMLPVLLGMGLRRLSMDAEHIPEVQKRISAINMLEAADLSKRLTRLSSIADIEASLDPKSGSV